MVINAAVFGSAFLQPMLIPLARLKKNFFLNESEKKYALNFLAACHFVESHLIH